MSLRIDKLTRYYGGVSAVNQVSLEVDAGCLHGLMGPNGAGKTTLMNLISGIEMPHHGTITWNGTDLTHVPAWKRYSLGIVRSFQVNRLIPSLSVLENMLLWIRMDRTGETPMGAWFRRRRWLARYDEAVTRCRDLLTCFSLDSRMEAFAGTLSFGQQKLVTMACMIAAEPSLLLLDEPFSGIAPAMADLLAHELRRQTSEGCTILVIEHDLDRLFRISDQVTVMRQGAVIATGAPEEIRSNESVVEAYLQ